MGLGPPVTLGDKIKLENNQLTASRRILYQGKKGELTTQHMKYIELVHARPRTKSSVLSAAYRDYRKAATKEFKVSAQLEHFKGRLFPKNLLPPLP